MLLTHHTRKTALYFRVRAITVMVSMVTRRPSGWVGWAVWTWGHVGTHLGQFGCDQLYNIMLTSFNYSLNNRFKEQIYVFQLTNTHTHTVLSFKLSCPISFLSSAGSTTSPPINSSILVWAALAFILFRMPRRTEPIVSLVCDQMSKSSTWRPWLGKRTISVMCFPRKALQDKS